MAPATTTPTTTAIRRISSTWARRLRNGAVALAVLAALYALVGFLVLPLVAKPRIEAALTEQLGRRATIGRLEFNPFTFHGRIADFVLADRDPQRTLARFASLDLDVSTASIWKRAPVLDAVRLVRPQIDLVRESGGAYNVDDLATRKSEQPQGEPLGFSINNIEVEDGMFSLDDRVRGHKIVVSNVGIGIPFLSSFPHDAEIRVTPRFDGAVDGTRFALTGSSTSPFAERQEATLELNLDALPLERYADYARLPNGLRLTSGKLTTRLRLAFVTQQGAARSVALSGTARLDDAALARKDGSPLAGVRSVDVALAKLDWLERSVALDRVSVEGPNADLRREPDGAFELVRLTGGAASASPAPASMQAQAPQRPWAFSVADARIADGTLRVADRSVAPEFDVVLSKIAVEGKRIASSGGPGNVEAHYDADDGAHFDLQGEVDPGKRTARGRFSVKTLHLARLYPYYASHLNLEVRRGTLDLAGDFGAGDEAGAAQFTLAQGTAVASDVETALPGEKDALWRVARGDVTGIAFDLRRQSLTIDRAAVAQGSIRIVRDADGTTNFARLARHDAATRSAGGAAGASAASGRFGYLIRRLEVEGITADYEDRVANPAVKLHVSDARVSVTNLGRDRTVRSALELAGRIGAKGRVRAAGTVVLEPLAVDCRIDASGIDVVPLRPYFEPRTNIVVTSGSVDLKGRLGVAAAREGPVRGNYKGDVTIANFGSLDRPTSQELVRFNKLALTGVDAVNEPFSLAIDAIGLDQFYARIILNPDATLNLGQLLAPAPQAAAEAGVPKTVAGVTTKDLPAPATDRGLPVSIGRIEVANGEVQYSDFFVKPNYTAHLTGVAGRVGALSASQAGDVQVNGQVEGTAPVDVRGTLNPFAPQLQLDLTGKASDVDLPPLTPYSVKYAGYGITKGKLSLEVHYKVDNRKLAATNKLKLDQLTFGEHVDSPTATKLPLLLAVSLLKDRNGVINLDLPIQGTLDDPKFSVWGVIVQIVVNLITKAVTAPFALLGSIAGGAGGEQLAYIEFAPGKADLSADAQAKLTTLAKALADRPALKIDATGRAIPDLDREGLEHAALDRAIRAQKQKTLAAQGESAPSIDTLAIDAAEYPKLLADVYRATDLPDKPRNILGIAKTIPPAEMETLLLASYKVDDQALATLANRRSQAVKEWFADKGGVAPERVFIVTPKLNAEGIGDKGAPTRVDFAIR